MPFPLIPTALGVCFLLVWAFIGGMIFRDGQLTARHERELDANILPLDTGPMPGSARAQQKISHFGPRGVRAAS